MIEWKPTRQWNEPAFEAVIERFLLRAYLHPKTGYGYVVEHESDGYDANGLVESGAQLGSLDEARIAADAALRTYLWRCLNAIVEP